MPPWPAVPVIGWFLWFLLVPLAIVAIYSVSSRGVYGGVEYRVTLENYLRSAEGLYVKVLWNSVKLAILTSVSCLAIGFPMAYVMATSRKSIRSLLLLLVVIPFWTNFVVRAYAIKLLLLESGPLQAVLFSMGLLAQPIPLSNSEIAVWMGMVTNYLPFMVLPLFVAMEKTDFTLLEAARDLGASPSVAIWRVLVPLVKPGIITGLIFVFTPALGEFVIPDLLGGARTMLVGNLITDQFLKTRDWPFGSALSLLLMVLVLASLGLYLRVESQEKLKQRAPRA